MPSLSLPELIPPSLRPFLTLSYPIKYNVGPYHETLYGKGINDLYYAILWAIGLTVLRQVLLTFVFEPLGKLVVPSPPIPPGGSKAKREHEIRTSARKKHHSVVRFAEQLWSFLYCTVLFGMGCAILSRIPNRTSPEQLWGTYPYTPIPGLTKFYYLTQLGWWFHQIYVINAEKRRKDHWQMFGHHLLSIALIVGSYLANYTRVGVVVHSLMDLCDIFLPLAKLLRYMELSTACDLTFVVFLLSWAVSRQYGLAMVIRTVWVNTPKYIPFKWDPENDYYFTPSMYYGFCGMLSILLVLCTVWFYMAVMVAVRVVRGQGAEDSRSDDEEESSDVEEEERNGNGHAAMSNGVGTNGASERAKSTSASTNGYANGNNITRRK